MIQIDELKGEIVRLIGVHVPSVRVVRIHVEQANDSDGEPSLFVRVVANKRPESGQELVRRLADVVDQLRTWLAKKDDSRFPYLEYLTEGEEHELQQAGE